MGYVQNIITCTYIVTYTQETCIISFASLPVLDVKDENEPITALHPLNPEFPIPIYTPMSFSGNNIPLSVQDMDKPLFWIEWENEHINDDQSTLEAFYFYAKFVVWLAARNKSTNQVVYLWHFEWELFYDLTFNPQMKTVISVKANLKTKDGSGVGLDEQGEEYVPNLEGPIANSRLSRNETQYIPRD